MQLDLNLKCYCAIFVLPALIYMEVVLDSSILIDIEHTGNEKHPHKCNITMYIKLSNYGNIYFCIISAQEMKGSSFMNLKTPLKRHVKPEMPFAHKGDTE